ncbi:MAG: hypothetical protein ACTHMS_24055 [Jatrophihabitans sp.]
MGNIGPQRQRYEVLPDRVDTAAPAERRSRADEPEQPHRVAEPAGRDPRD